MPVATAHDETNHFENAAAQAARFMELAHKHGKTNEHEVKEAIKMYTKLMNPPDDLHTQEMHDIENMTNEIKNLLVHKGNQAPTFFVLLACRALEKHLGNLRHTMAAAEPLQKNKIFLRFYLDEVQTKMNELSVNVNESITKEIIVILKESLKKGDTHGWELELLHTLEDLCNNNKIVYFQELVPFIKDEFTMEFTKVTLPVMTVIRHHPELSPFGRATSYTSNTLAPAKQLFHDGFIERAPANEENYYDDVDPTLLYDLYEDETIYDVLDSDTTKKTAEPA